MLLDNVARAVALLPTVEASPAFSADTRVGVIPPVACIDTIGTGPASTVGVAPGEDVLDALPAAAFWSRLVTSFFPVREVCRGGGMLQLVDRAGNG